MCQATKEQAVGSDGLKDPNRLPTEIKPKLYVLDILLKESTSEFFGVAQIKADVLQPTEKIMFHAKNLAIDEIEVFDESGKSMAIQDKKVYPETIELQVSELKAETEIVIRVEYHATIIEGMAGFYKSEVRNENKGYIYSTQFEATSARLALPCWDEPEYKAVFAISITAPEQYTVLSNSDYDGEQSKEELPSEFLSKVDQGVNYQKHTFKPTLVMSTYLLAWVIGEMDVVGDGSVKVYSPKGEGEKGRFSLNTAIKCLDFFNQYFDIPYQMEKLDMVAIPGFSAGAMENWGLVTYRSSSLHYTEGSTTEMNKLQIASTVCHELAHQWFGNLVTMKWWNDLWLNEGFATWAGTLATAAISKEIDLKYDAWEDFLESDITRGMNMDGKLSTHPINMPVHSAGEISSIFDAISYSKGASMIHMLANYIGKDEFRDGLRRYIKKHQYENTTTSDLWNAIDEDGSKKISESMKNWIDRPGMPHVTVSIDGDDLVLEQRRYLPKHSEQAGSEADEPWKIFLTKKGFKESSGTPETESVLFNQHRYVLHTESLPMIFNADASGFYRVHYSSEILEKHIKPLLKGDKLSPFDRFGILRDAIRFAIDGHESALSAIEMISYVKKTDTSAIYLLAAGFLSMVRTGFEDVPEIKLAAETELVNLLQSFADDVKDYTKVNDNVERRKIEILATSTLAGIKGSSMQKMIMKIAKENNLKTVNKEYKLSMYIALARFGGEEGYTFLHQLITGNSDENEKIRAITAISFSEDKMKEAFGMFLKEKSEVPNQDKMRMVNGLSSYKNRKKTLSMFFENFDALVKQFKSTLDHIASFVHVFLSAQNKKENIEMAKKFFENPSNVKDAWAPAIKKGLDNAVIAEKFYSDNLSGLKQWAEDKKVI
ncbi:puromycin-sensitive aminopeptidase [Nematocida displodere]|uniref:Aminopeptidase n=1 Tax=Nematocida displodere TaxID=1805483 RepID=A0A177ED97_9MICR|nr:puromycin-sensitive aminopeptidase [Nematocida displodere]